MAWKRTGGEDQEDRPLAVRRRQPEGLQAREGLGLHPAEAREPGQRDRWVDRREGPSQGRKV